MRVLGIDPGLTRCGLGVVEGEPGRSMRAAHISVLRSSPEADIGERLHGIYVRTQELLMEFQPDRIAIERVFSQHNTRTVMGTAQAAGVAALAAHQAGVPMELYTPSEVKAAVTGSGAAGKAQVGSMVVRILGLTEVPKPADAADALALAIADIWRGTARRKVAAAVARST